MQALFGSSVPLRAVACESKTAAFNAKSVRPMQASEHCLKASQVDAAKTVLRPPPVGTCHRILALDLRLGEGAEVAVLPSKQPREAIKAVPLPTATLSPD